MAIFNPINKDIYPFVNRIIYSPIDWLQLQIQNSLHIQLLQKVFR